MYYKTEFDINHFQFWNGARYRMEDATDEQIKQVEERIEDCFCCDEYIPTDDDINNLVWFECDDIFYPEKDEDEDDPEMFLLR